jgi:glycerol-3-phosphate dehydrogenase
VPKLYDGDHAYILQNKDDRIVFALPYTDDTTAIGTTDIVYQDNLDDINIDESEKNYLCDLINQYFAKQITHDNIIGDWSGVRALATTQTADASAMTREHQLHLLSFEQAPLLTVLGGKLTNARLIGEEALDKLKPFLPWKNNISSKGVPLPGGDLDAKGLQDLEHSLVQQYAFIEASVIKRLVEQYGSESKTLLSGAKTAEDLGQHFGHGLYALEVDFLVKYYFVETVDDVLFRATRMKTQFSKDEIEELEKHLPLSKIKDFDSPQGE